MKTCGTKAAEKDNEISELKKKTKANQNQPSAQK
jgi:hypothetical protein